MNNCANCKKDISNTIITEILPCGHKFCDNCYKTLILECLVCYFKIHQEKLYFFSTQRPKYRDKVTE